MFFSAGLSGSARPRSPDSEGGSRLRSCRSHGIIGSPQGQSHPDARISARQVCSVQQAQQQHRGHVTQSSCCANTHAASHMQCRTACSSPCTTLPLIPGGWVATGTHGHSQQPLSGHRCRFIPAALPDRKRCGRQTPGRRFVAGKPHQRYLHTSCNEQHDSMQRSCAGQPVPNPRFVIHPPPAGSAACCPAHPRCSLKPGAHALCIMTSGICSGHGIIKTLHTHP